MKTKQFIKELSRLPDNFEISFEGFDDEELSDALDETISNALQPDNSQSYDGIKVGGQWNISLFGKQDN
ncbi:MAG: hypothetical protein F6K62_17745 [Sphaerospermopsis sp. SIO1G2]|nr:hypothetical protein [Sphaerospermopsis sp. SIO1G2]